MSQLWIPPSVQAPRPNRKARRAQALSAGPKQFANMQRPAGLPAHLPPPQLKVGWNEDNVVMIVVFGPNELPLPFEPEQARQLAAALFAAAKQVDELKAPVEEEPLSPEAAELLEEAQANVQLQQPGVAEAVADSPVD